jgi:hypothetical protein
MKFSTYLPVFCGFYESIFTFDYDSVESDIHSQRDDKGLYSYSKIDIEIDDSQYEYDIVNSFIDNFQSAMSDYIGTITFEKINHPREYNFHTDSVDVIIDINVDNIRGYIYKNKDIFCEFLKKGYTSRSGFISHYEPDFDIWESDTKGFTDYSCNGHYLGSILDFIAHKEGVDNFSLCDDVLSDICSLNYCTNMQECIDYTDGSLYECFTSNAYTKDIAQYYSDTYANGFISQLNLDEKTLSIIKEYEEAKG